MAAFEASSHAGNGNGKKVPLLVYPQIHPGFRCRRVAKALMAHIGVNCRAE